MFHRVEIRPRSNLQLKISESCVFVETTRSLLSGTGRAQFLFPAHPCRSGSSFHSAIFSARPACVPARGLVKWLSASRQCDTGMAHFFAAWGIAKNNNFSADS